MEDALHSTRAAVEEGIVAGGGVALIRALQNIEDLAGDNEDQNVGINIAKRAMTSPLRQIAQNSGAEGAVVPTRCAGSRRTTVQRRHREYGDMIEMGIPIRPRWSAPRCSRPLLSRVS